MTLSELSSTWCTRADELAPFSPAAAEAFRRAAQELRAALTQLEGEVITLEQAATESGYSREHLARAVRTGRIPNAGRKGAPRVRRVDLPVKPGSLSNARLSDYDPITDARSLVSRR